MNLEQDLEKLVDRELQSLPAPRAPETLASRVMAAITAQAALPWHRRTWFEWPRGWQIASALLAVTLVIALVALPPWPSPVPAEWLGEVAEVPGVLLRAALLTWDSLFHRLLVYVLVCVAALSVVVIALGSAVARLVTEEVRP